MVVILAKGAVSWHSRMQTVTVSGTSKAKYVALSEAVKEVLLLRQVQGFMEPSVRIGTANVFEGAIKPATNKNEMFQIKHIDVKHLVRDACEVGKVRVYMSGRKISSRTCSPSR